MKDIRRHSDRFTDMLQKVIRWAVRALAILMTLVIVLGVVDVAWQLHQKAMAPPAFILTISDMLGMFGAFMAVLIAIEIFVNITIYLREDVIHVKIVMATALMATLCVSNQQNRFDRLNRRNRAFSPPVGLLSRSNSCDSR